MQVRVLLFQSACYPLLDHLVLDECMIKLLAEVTLLLFAPTLLKWLTVVCFRARHIFRVVSNEKHGGSGHL